MTQRFARPAFIAASCVLASILAACGPEAENAPADAAPATDASTSDQPGGRGGRGGAMTLADMRTRADQRFDAADADGDGVVTTAELDAQAEQRDGPEGGPGGRGGGRGLARADADGDGRITRDEARAQVAERFARMDADGDGTISEDERPQRGGGRREGDGPVTPQT